MSRCAFRIVAAAIAAAVQCAPAQWEAAQAAGRVALVIGNAAYENAEPLATAVNDAGDIAASLERLDFEVAFVSEVGLAAMTNILDAFATTAAGAEIAAVYYSGLGLQSGGNSFLIPVDARLARDTDIAAETVPVEAVVEAASGASALALVMLDAAHRNPFVSAIVATSEELAPALGVDAPQVSPPSVVSLAARPGTQSVNRGGRNSAYAESLLSFVEKPGVDVGSVFGQLRDKVLELTDSHQEPFITGALPATSIYLAGPAR